MSIKIRSSIFDITDLSKQEKYKFWEKQIMFTIKKNDKKIIEGVLFKKSKKTGVWK